VDVIVPAKKSINAPRKAFIIVESWVIDSLEDILNEPKEEEESGLEKSLELLINKSEAKPWNCPACTLENSAESEICDICEFPRPPPAEPQEEPVPEKDNNLELEKLEQKLQKLQKERFLALGVSI
jgi:hypothetical protein